MPLFALNRYLVQCHFSEWWHPYTIRTDMSRGGKKPFFACFRELANISALLSLHTSAFTHPKSSSSQSSPIWRNKQGIYVQLWSFRLLGFPIYLQLPFTWPGGFNCKRGVNDASHAQDQKVWRCHISSNYSDPVTKTVKELSMISLFMKRHIIAKVTSHICQCDVTQLSVWRHIIASVTSHLYIQKVKNAMSHFSFD